MDMTDRELLRRHVNRTGANRAAESDAYAHLQITMLDVFLSVAHSACDDEGLSPQQTGRILDRIIYGCIPSAAEVEYRQMVVKDAAGLLGRVDYPTKNSDVGAE